MKLLTPNDIKTKRISSAWVGYDIGEVDGLLDECERTIQVLDREILDCQTKASNARDRCGMFEAENEILRRQKRNSRHYHHHRCSRLGNHHDR